MMDFANLRVDVPEGTSGPWSIQRFVVPENDLGALRYAMHGRPVPAGTYTRLKHDKQWDPMMSDTPAEMKDYLRYYSWLDKKWCRRVLLNGLGIGMAVKWALDSPNVESVDVVELDEDIIYLVADHYLKMADERGKELTIYHDNAMEKAWPTGTQWDVAYHDIWPNICSDNLPEMAKLKRMYGHRVKVQECWVEYECRRLKKEDGLW
jgi:hypothetical protein